jgi:hypothetical protein
LTKRLFDFDQNTGMKTVFEDLGDDGFALHTTQDVEPILDANKAKANMGRDYYAASKDIWRVASIPMSVQLKWMVEEGIDVYNPEHMPRIKKKLNDPEWRHLKTADVRI